MKSTGVIRRIDELGRIVIPKEIRKSLKIKDGDTLEIFIEGQSIILKKFSLMSDMVSIANKLVSVANNLIHKKIIITNKEKIIACNKDIEKKYLDKPLSSFLLLEMEKRKEIDHFKDEFQIIPMLTENYCYYICPIIVDSEILGMVMVFDDNSIDEYDKLVCRMINSFLIKNIED